MGDAVFAHQYEKHDHIYNQILSTSQVSQRQCFLEIASNIASQRKIVARETVEVLVSLAQGRDIQTKPNSLYLRLFCYTTAYEIAVTWNKQLPPNEETIDLKPLTKELEKQLKELDACRVKRAEAKLLQSQHETDDGVICLFDDESLFHHFTDLGNLSALFYLLDTKQVDASVVNGCSVDGKTPLHMAIERKDKALCDFLIEHSAKLTEPDDANKSGFQRMLGVIWDNSIKSSDEYCKKIFTSEQLQKELIQISERAQRGQFIENCLIAAIQNTLLETSVYLVKNHPELQSSKAILVSLTCLERLKEQNRGVLYLNNAAAEQYEIQCEIFSYLMDFLFKQPIEQKGVWTPELFLRLIEVGEVDFIKKVIFECQSLLDDPVLYHAYFVHKLVRKVFDRELFEFIVEAKNARGNKTEILYQEDNHQKPPSHYAASTGNWQWIDWLSEQSGYKVHIKRHFYTILYCAVTAECERNSQIENQKCFLEAIFARLPKLFPEEKNPVKSLLLTQHQINDLEDACKDIILRKELKDFIEQRSRYSGKILFSESQHSNALKELLTAYFAPLNDYRCFFTKNIFSLNEPLWLHRQWYLSALAFKQQLHTCLDSVRAQSASSISTHITIDVFLAEQIYQMLAEQDGIREQPVSHQDCLPRDWSNLDLGTQATLLQIVAHRPDYGPYALSLMITYLLRDKSLRNRNLGLSLLQGQSIQLEGITLALNESQPSLLDLPYIDLSWTCWEGLTIDKLDLSGQYLRGLQGKVDAKGGAFRYACLQRGDLARAKFNNADLTGADLTQCMLNNNMNFCKVSLNKANLYQANLSNIRANYSNAQDAHFLDANYDGRWQDAVNMEGAITGCESDKIQLIELTRKNVKAYLHYSIWLEQCIQSNSSSSKKIEKQKEGIEAQKALFEPWRRLMCHEKLPKVLEEIPIAKHMNAARAMQNRQLWHIRQLILLALLEAKSNAMLASIKTLNDAWRINPEAVEAWLNPETSLLPTEGHFLNEYYKTCRDWLCKKMDNTHTCRLMHAIGGPSMNDKSSGIYLYRDSSPEKDSMHDVYALIIDDQKKHETFNLTDLAKEHHAIGMTLEEIVWPKNENIEAPLKERLLRLIEENQGQGWRLLPIANYWLHRIAVWSTEEVMMKNKDIQQDLLSIVRRQYKGKGKGSAKSAQDKLSPLPKSLEAWCANVLKLHDKDKKVFIDAMQNALRKLKLSCVFNNVSIIDYWQDYIQHLPFSDGMHLATETSYTQFATTLQQEFIEPLHPDEQKNIAIQAALSQFLDARRDDAKHRNAKSSDWDKDTEKWQEFIENHCEQAKQEGRVLVGWVDKQGNTHWGYLRQACQSQLLLREDDKHHKHRKKYLFNPNAEGRPYTRNKEKEKQYIGRCITIKVTTNVCFRQPCVTSLF